MNRFSKTSYPRHVGQYGFLNSSVQNRQRTLNYDEKQELKSKNRFQPHDHSQPLHNLIQKKIEIDPSLLLNGRANSRGGKLAHQSDKYGLVSREMCSTTNDSFYKKPKERPTSKQQQRIKIVENLSLNKHKEQTTIKRPETSKGQRNIVYNRESRKKSLGDDLDYETNNKRESKTAVGSRRRNTAQQIELQASIDSDFLALFAK